MTGVFAGLNLIYLAGANKRKEQRKLEASAAAWHVEGDRHPSFKYTLTFASQHYSLLTLPVVSRYDY